MSFSHVSMSSETGIRMIGFRPGWRRRGGLLLFECLFGQATGVNRDATLVPIYAHPTAPRLRGLVAVEQSKHTAHPVRKRDRVSRAASLGPATSYRRPFHAHSTACKALGPISSAIGASDSGNQDQFMATSP